MTRTAAFVALITFALSNFARSGSAQTVDFTPGGSQIIGVYGVQSNFSFRKVFGWTGVGYYGGFNTSGYLNTPLYKKTRLGLGDHEFDAAFATDEFDYYRVTGRGVSTNYFAKNRALQTFVGEFSYDYRVPYFYTVPAATGNITGMLSGYIKVSPKLEFRTYNAFGDTATAIQSLQYKPGKQWMMSTAEGVGAGCAYAANAVEFKRRTLDLRASYTLATSKFRRQDGAYEIEPLGLNARAEIPIGDNLVFHGYHRREMTVVPKYLGFTRSSSIGAVDLAGLTAGFLGFRTNLTVNKSTCDAYPGTNYSGMASITRSITPRFRTTFSYLHSITRQDLEVYQAMSEYRVNNHFAISHNFALMNGQPRNTIGGRISFNAISITADNQVYVSDVAAQFGQKSVFQAWNFTLRLRTAHGTQTHLETIVDPFGKTEWGGYLSGLRYRSLSTPNAPGNPHVNFSKYLISGIVVDESGKGVWGIALRIGSEIVMSGMDGRFFTHVRNNKRLPFAVASESSLQARHWVVAEAPGFAQGDPENGKPIRVVIQMTSSLVAASDRAHP
jgi:hypothetical protein